MKPDLTTSLDAVARWVESHDYQAYDPGDGQLSFLASCCFNRQFLCRLLTAAVLRTPIHIRPWIGVRPHCSTKGMGYMAWGYVKCFAETSDERFAAKARFCLDWLIQHRSAQVPQYCWGNHFAFSTRGGTIPAFEPTIVWSSLIGLAFVEAYEV